MPLVSFKIWWTCSDYHLPSVSCLVELTNSVCGDSFEKLTGKLRRPWTVRIKIWHWKCRFASIVWKVFSITRNQWSYSEIGAIKANQRDPVWPVESGGHRAGLSNTAALSAATLNGSGTCTPRNKCSHLTFSNNMPYRQTSTSAYARPFRPRNPNGP